MPQIEKALTRFSQVGALRLRLGLSEYQTLPIATDLRSRKNFVDYEFSELRTLQVSILLYRNFV